MLLVDDTYIKENNLFNIVLFFVFVVLFWWYKSVQDKYHNSSSDLILNGNSLFILKSILSITYKYTGSSLRLSSEPYPILLIILIKSYDSSHV